MHWCVLSAEMHVFAKVISFVLPPDSFPDYIKLENVLTDRLLFLTFCGGGLRLPDPPNYLSNFMLFLRFNTLETSSK